ncbi:MAG TPA: phosphate/phosphite/phosphonate ABC transporter substrate-binding protein [Stellaceae bacterium]|nr:phosphate/phosphite/phosphonate ABC transporter substrate-binding protein [Stellaceae bacterium]
MRKQMFSAALAVMLGFAAVPALAAPADCPEGGTVRFGVEPFEAAQNLIPIFDKIGATLSKAVGCPVKVFITTSYNAEIEAMRNGKLEAGEFGPLGYVLAHQVAKAQAVATFTDKAGKPETYTASIVSWPGSGITKLSQVQGKTFAYSDPSSTSGHLFPAYGLRKAGIDPDHGITALYAGSHTATFEALRNHKVQAGELNSEEVTATQAQGIYKASDFVTLWTSQPIPVDPIAVRGDLPPAFKKKLVSALQHLDLSHLSEQDKKHLAGEGDHLAPTTDATFNQIRDLVKTLKVDLAKL